MNPSDKAEMLERHLDKAMAEVESSDWWEESQRAPEQIQHWLPLVESSGVKSPRTLLVECSKEAYGSFVSVALSEVTDEFLSRLDAAVREIGTPVFLRNGIMSAKHSWKSTCYVDKACWLGLRVFRIIEANEMAFGAPPGGTFAVREFIKADAYMFAFDGDMPITREVRMFVRNGRVECWHPYWPLEAIKNPKPHPDVGETPEFEHARWLERCNDIPEEDIEFLRSEVEQKLAPKMEGYWPDEYYSVDWLMDNQRQWWCIDMARGSRSYHWKGCPKRG